MRECVYLYACVGSSTLLSLSADNIMAYQALKGRLGAVKNLLRSLQGQPLVLESTAAAQSEGLEALLRQRACELNAAQLASIQLKLAETWEGDNLQNLLGALNGEAAQGVGRKTNRRKQESTMQDYKNWHFLITNSEWDNFELVGQDVYTVAGMITEIVCSRMWCCNPEERTLKFIASCAMAIAYSPEAAMRLPVGVKVAVRDHVRNQTKSYWRFVSKPLEHCNQLPCSLQQLSREHPLLHAHMEACIGDAPLVASRLPTELAKRIDASYKCRNNQVQQALAPAGGSENNLMGMLQMQMQMMMQMSRQGMGGGQEGELELDFTGDARSGAKRSLGALKDAFAPQPTWKRQRTPAALGDAPCSSQDAGSLMGQMMLAVRGSQEQPPAGLPPALPPALPPPPPPPPVLPPAPPPALPPALPPLPDAPRETEEPDATADLQKSPEEEGKALLDALIARDAQAKQDAAEARKVIAAQKAAEKAAQKAAEKAEKAEAKQALRLVLLPAKAAQKAGAKNAAPVADAVASPGLHTLDAIKAQTLVAKSPGKPKKSPLPTAGAKPTFSHERTRSQFLCRTGITGPGQSTAIRYTPKSELTLKQAEARANKWLNDHRATFALAGA